MVSRLLFFSSVFLLVSTTAGATLDRVPGTFPTAAKGHPSGAIGESHVFFPRGGTEIDELGELQILLLGELLNGSVLMEACVHLIGHSDSGGEKQVNLNIAQKRAQAVADALSAVVDIQERIQLVTANGENAPLSTLPDRSRWQRRVEIRAARCRG